MHRPVLVTAPTETPVSSAEAKAHLRVDDADEDGLIDVLIEAATTYLDGYTGVLGRALVTQSWRQDFDDWNRMLRLPLLAAAATSVKYRSSDGTLSTVSADSYALKADALGSYIRFDDGYGFPGDLAQSSGVLVEFSAGYGAAADVPAALKMAILLLVAHWYHNREAAGPSATAELPLSVNALIAPYRLLGP